MEETKVTPIVIDDGTVEVPINNLFGEQVGTFYFVPTDVGIITRFNEVSEKFKDVVEPLQNVNINPDGTANSDTEIEVLEQAKTKLFELCDYLFGGNLSEAFFGKVNPFSPKNGVFYCERALNLVAEYVGKQFDSEINKINTRVEKYTHGLRTGKHKDGKK